MIQLMCQGKVLIMNAMAKEYLMTWEFCSITANVRLKIRRELFRNSWDFDWIEDLLQVRNNKMQYNITKVAQTDWFYQHLGFSNELLGA